MARRAMQPGDFTKTNKATSMKQVVINGKTELRKREKGEKGTRIHCYMAQGSACTPAGKVVRKKVYGQTVREATEKLYGELEYLATYRPGSNPISELQPNSPFGDAYRLWQKYLENVRGRKETSTYQYHKSYKRVRDKIQNIALEDFHPVMLEEIMQKEVSDCSYNQALQLRKVLNGTLSHAVRLGALDHNPVRETHLYKPAGTQGPAAARAFTDAEVKAILDTAKDSPRDLYDLCCFMRGTGVRIGGALALYWEKGPERDYVDLKTGELHTGSFTAEVITGKGPVISRHGSSKEGERILALPKKLVTLLKKRRKEHPEDLLLFPNYNARTKVRSVKHASAEMSDLFTEAGITWKATSHSWRDSYAGMLVASGYPVNVVGDALGHRSYQTTILRYFPHGTVPMKDVAAVINNLL